MKIQAAVMKEIPEEGKTIEAHTTPTLRRYRVNLKFSDVLIVGFGGVFALPMDRVRGSVWL